MIYICEFGRAGRGGGAPDLWGTFGSSLAVGAFVGFCLFGSGGGVAMAFGAGGWGRLIPGGDGARRLGLAVFALLGCS